MTLHQLLPLPWFVENGKVVSTNGKPVPGRFPTKQYKSNGHADEGLVLVPAGAKPLSTMTHKELRADHYQCVTFPMSREALAPYEEDMRGVPGTLWEIVCIGMRSFEIWRVPTKVAQR
jgi:hypothetical protein